MVFDPGWLSEKIVMPYLTPNTKRNSTDIKGLVIKNKINEIASGKCKTICIFLILESESLSMTSNPETVKEKMNESNN